MPAFKWFKGATALRKPTLRRLGMWMLGLTALLLASCQLVPAAEKTDTTDTTDKTVNTVNTVNTNTRRSGFDFMSSATQALQKDDNANPAFLWVQGGAQRFANTCANCHSSQKMRGVATRYPAWNETLGRPVTLATRINQCQTQQVKAAAFAAESDALLELESFVAHQSRGLPLQAVADPRLHSALKAGQQLWQQRLGQLQLSCAECHDQYAGRRLGGSTVPQAHPTGYPIYRLEWQGLGSLERRLRGCFNGVRAEAFASDATEWVALQLWLRQRAAGMAIETPGVRP